MRPASHNFPGWSQFVDIISIGSEHIGGLLGERDVTVAAKARTVTTRGRGAAGTANKRRNCGVRGWRKRVESPESRLELSSVGELGPGVMMADVDLIGGRTMRSRRSRRHRS